MEDYYFNILTEFVFSHESRWAIWYQKEKEGFFQDEKGILCTREPQALKDYARKSRITLVEDSIFRYRVDQLQKWILSSDTHIDCKWLLNFWNVIQDVSTTVNCDYMGNQRTKAIDLLYSKLFCGINLWVEKEEDKYIPYWLRKEQRLLRLVLKNGIQVLNQHLIPRDFL